MSNIGEILESGTIVRGETEQGKVYKNYDAFESRVGICYIPELNDTAYTYDDILAECNGSEDITREIFYTLDWQSPSSLYNDYLNSEEIHQCTGCKKSFFCYEVDLCPFCKKSKNID